MTKKEGRLSPVARKLLSHAKNLASAPHPDNEKIVNYLQSVSPEKLTLYDRQKIGREILVRYSRKAGQPTNEEIRKAYDLNEHEDFSANRKDIIKKMLEGNACFKKGSYGCSAQDYREAALAAKNAGFYDLAIKGYERAIKTFDEADKIDGQRLPKNYRGGLGV
jgi:tetratricopeptide (TPR) repeat protein